MALIGWAGGLLGTQVQFLQVAAGLDVAGADAGAEADAGDVQEQALGGFQIAAFEAVGVPVAKETSEIPTLLKQLMNK